jgi:hypothetical protein
MSTLWEIKHEGEMNGIRRAFENELALVCLHADNAKHEIDGPIRFGSALERIEAGLIRAETLQEEYARLKTLGDPT